MRRYYIIGVFSERACSPKCRKLVAHPPHIRREGTVCVSHTLHVPHNPPVSPSLLFNPACGRARPNTLIQWSVSSESHQPHTEFFIQLTGLRSRLSVNPTVSKVLQPSTYAYIVHVERSSEEMTSYCHVCSIRMAGEVYITKEMNNGEK